VVLQGGPVELPDGTEAHAAGLTERLQQEQLADRVNVVEADFLDADGTAQSSLLRRLEGPADLEDRAVRRASAHRPASLAHPPLGCAPGDPHLFSDHRKGMNRS
jgi:hypothetical protein